MFFNQRDNNGALNEELTDQGGKSLNDPETVSDLVGGFAENVVSLLNKCVEDEIDNKELDRQIKDLSLRLGDIFSGREDGWVVTTWNTERFQGLQSKARALLAGVRVNSGQDSNFEPSNPVAGLFHLLSCHVISAYKAAHRGDENHKLPETMRFIIGTLLEQTSQ